MTIHARFTKGKRIIAILKDGTKVIGKFIQSKSGWMEIEGFGRIKTSQLRSTNIYKATTDA